MKEIALTKGKVAIVDDDDFESLSRHRWHYSNGYAGRNTVTARGWRIQKMHRVILPVSDGMKVDHINGNKLDNRRSNLRVCTPGQNRANTGAMAKSKQKYKGVTFDKKFKKKYGARIVHEGKIHLLGRYDTPEDAARAYNAARVNAWRKGYAVLCDVNGVLYVYAAEGNNAS